MADPGELPVPRRSAGGPAGAARADAALPDRATQRLCTPPSARSGRWPCWASARLRPGSSPSSRPSPSAGTPPRTASIRDRGRGRSLGAAGPSVRRGPRGNPSPARRAPPPPVQARPGHPRRVRRGRRAGRGGVPAPDGRAAGEHLGAWIGTLDRLRWALSAPGRWLERAPPFQAAAALTFLLSMGQTVVVIPIAVATVGPLVAAASIAVIGVLALAATARSPRPPPETARCASTPLLRPPGHQRPRPQRRGDSNPCWGSPVSPCLRSRRSSAWPCCSTWRSHCRPNWGAADRAGSPSCSASGVPRRSGPDGARAISTVLLAAQHPRPRRRRSREG